MVVAVVDGPAIAESRSWLSRRMAGVRSRLGYAGDTGEYFGEYSGAFEWRARPEKR